MISTHLSPRPALAVLALVACACSGAGALTPELAPDDDPHAEGDQVARAHAFQTRYDAELEASTHSFLTAVDGFYLDAAGTLELGLSADGETWRPDAQPSRLRFRVEGEALVATIDAQPARTLDQYTLIPVDEGERWTLQLSPQGELAWRILIHDADAAAREHFEGIAWFPVDPELVVQARYEPDPTRPPTVLATSRGETKTLYRAGSLRFEVGGRSAVLDAFGYSPDAPDTEPLLVPFRDRSTGHESYGGGRYLEIDAPDSDTGGIPLDFNRATNPLCAYSALYNCPVPPKQNRIDSSILAGARAPTDH